MKKFITKALSLVLILSIVFNLSVPVFATENYDSVQTFTLFNIQQEDIEAAYAALTPKAKPSLMHP